MNKKFLQKAECASGYPAMNFEYWYQQGMMCHMLRLPKWLRKEVFAVTVKYWPRNGGGAVAMWQVRAFVDGSTGRDSAGVRKPFVSPDYLWPDAPPKGWEFVVCAYPDGACEFDYVHPVSRKFWSEDNAFLPNPPDPKGRVKGWFDEMGMPVMVMNPDMLVVESSRTQHLSVV